MKPITREEIVACATTWIGTPYRHHASLKGVGADCLGLLMGVHRELVGALPETLPAYTPDWGEIADGSDVFPEFLLEGVKRHLREKAIAEMQAGDVLLFRMKDFAPVKHAGILADPKRMIHAYSGRGVRRSFLGPWWRARLEYVFAFPQFLDNGE